MTSRIKVGIIIVTLAAMCAALHAEMTPLRQKEVEKLVAQLGHRDFKTREAATQKIIAFGRDAIPTLKKSLATKKDKGIHFRCEIALEEILVSPSRVTIDVTDAPAGDVLKEIARQSGNKPLRLKTPESKPGSKQAIPNLRTAKHPPRSLLPKVLKLSKLVQPKQTYPKFNVCSPLSTVASIASA